MKTPNTECPITKVAKMLSDTWTMLILHHLIVGPKRFCELEKALEGISTRTLTLKLQKLTLEKLITKDSNNYYKTTKKADGLKMIEQAMRKYEKAYL